MYGFAWMTVSSDIIVTDCQLIQIEQYDCSVDTHKHLFLAWVHPRLNPCPGRKIYE